MTASSVTGKGQGDADRRSLYSQLNPNPVGKLGEYIQGTTLSEYDGVGDETFNTIDVSDKGTTFNNLGITGPGFYPLGLPWQITVDDSGYGGVITHNFAYLSTVSGTGLIIRVDLNALTTSTVDLRTTSGDTDLSDFFGGFTDGRYGYFTVASFNHTKIAKLDLQDFSTTTVLNISDVDADTFSGFGGCTDGLYGYTWLDFGTKVARYRLDDFTTASVEIIDFSSLLIGMGTPSTDGKYLYNTGHNLAGNQVFFKIPVNNFTIDAVESVKINVGTEVFGGGGTFPVGEYVYCIPDYHITFNPFVVHIDSHLVRVSKHDISDVSIFDLNTVDSHLGGYFGAWTDSQQRYLYLCPNQTTHMARVDTLNWPHVDFVDLSIAPFNLSGFNSAASGFSDGRFGYLVRSPTVFRFQLFPGGSLF